MDIWCDFFELNKTPQKLSEKMSKVSDIDMLFINLWFLNKDEVTDKAWFEVLYTDICINNSMIFMTQIRRCKHIGLFPKFKLSLIFVFSGYACMY